ncbi:RICIN domain-containing protein [Kitasatospora sp. NPDC059673]|uniref:RICIN domain-containing protein n=1 Tax=Kitasatospora sp. NPDC059673 TaxID=3346901 RepID=UPI0036B54FDC
MSRKLPIAVASLLTLAASLLVAAPAAHAINPCDAPEPPPSCIETPPPGGSGTPPTPRQLPYAYPESLTLGGWCVDVPNGSPVTGSAIQIWGCNNSGPQRWISRPVGNGVSWVNIGTGKCLDVKWGASVDGTAVWQWDCNGTPAQIWRDEPSPSGGRQLVNAGSGTCLDVPNADFRFGNPLQIRGCDDSPAQRLGRQAVQPWPGSRLRPIYAIAHNLNSVDRVGPALDAGYNAIEVDAANHAYGGCFVDNWEWVACDVGNPASENVDSGNLDRKRVSAIFDEMAAQRRAGRNLTLAWVDIKNPENRDLGTLKALARDKLVANGIQVIYEVTWDNDKRTLWDDLKRDLTPSEGVMVTGTYQDASIAFSYNGGGVTFQHRLVDDGSAIFATAVGTCDNEGSDKVAGLKQSTATRDAGYLTGVFSWTIGSSSGAAACAARLLGEAGVDGLIAGYKFNDYQRSGDTDQAVKNITDWINAHTDRARLATTQDTVFA